MIPSKDCELLEHTSLSMGAGAKHLIDNRDSFQSLFLVTGGNVLIWVNLEQVQCELNLPLLLVSFSPLLSLCGSLTLGP